MQGTRMLTKPRWQGGWKSGGEATVLWSFVVNNYGVVWRGA